MDVHAAPQDTRLGVWSVGWPGTRGGSGRNGRPQQQECDLMSLKFVCERSEQSIVVHSCCDVRPHRRFLQGIPFLAALLIVGVCASPASAQTNAACATYGNWID